MRCAKCESENSAGNNFCARCGNALVRPCIKCGAENAPTSNFCGHRFLHQAFNEGTREGMIPQKERHHVGCRLAGDRVEELRS
jgi:Double zinc ribbon